MSERSRLLTSIDKLKTVRDAAKRAAKEAKEEIEREQKKQEGRR